MFSNELTVDSRGHCCWSAAYHIESIERYCWRSSAGGGSPESSSIRSSGQSHLIYPVKNSNQRGGTLHDASYY